MVQQQKTANKAMTASHCLKSDSNITLLDGLERLIATACADSLHHVRFDLDGVPYEIYTDELDKTRLRITATLGYLPFSQESAEKREALLDILYATRSLTSVSFTLDRLNRIMVTGTFAAKDKFSPQFIFHPIALFQQQAQPFIQIIGHYI